MRWGLWWTMYACAPVGDPRPGRPPTGGEDSAPASRPPGASGGSSSSPTEVPHAEETAGTLETGAGAETARPSPAWRSALYPEDWTPGFSVGEWRLPDFSYAGYRNGEEPVAPAGPICPVEDEGADPTGALDSAPAFRAAVERCAKGGLVTVGPGTFRLDQELVIRHAGVVLRGAGPAATRIYFSGLDGMTDRAHLLLEGAPTDGPDLLLAQDAQAFSAEVLLADAGDLAPGDDVALGFVISDAFVDEHGMTGTWQVSNGQWRPIFRRQVVEVDRSVTPHRVVLDVPARYPARVRDGASLRRQSGYLREVGVEDLALSTVGDWDLAWTLARTHALRLHGVADGWVRRVETWESPLSTDGRGRHLASGGVHVRASKRVTVSDSTFERPQNRGEGGNGYLFEVGVSSEVLFRDCVARDGRHNFIQNWDFGTSGVVFLRTWSEGGRAYFAPWDPVGQLGTSEFHHSLAMSNLIDQSYVADGWQVANRHDYSSGAGHSATETVFWNLAGPGRVYSWSYGPGYVIGTREVAVKTSLGFFDPVSQRPEGTAPEDWTEGLGEGATLEPASLYEDQRRRRLGY